VRCWVETPIWHLGKRRDFGYRSAVQWLVFQIRYSGWTFEMRGMEGAWKNRFGWEQKITKREYV